MNGIVLYIIQLGDLTIAGELSKRDYFGEVKILLQSLGLDELENVLFGEIKLLFS